MSSLINSTLYNLGSFVLQQAYCNIASGESRNTSYRLEAVSVWSVAVITLTPALSLNPNPPKRVSIAAGAWVRDVSKWRCGYDVSAWVVLKVRGRDFGRQWRPTVAIWGEFDESAGNSGHPRSGPERSYGQDRLWCVRWSVVDTAVRPAEEWLAVWSVRDRTVFPRASAAGDAK